jgi:hypothetical protein
MNLLEILLVVAAVILAAIVSVIAVTLGAANRVLKSALQQVQAQAAGVGYNQTLNTAQVQAIPLYWTGTTYMVSMVVGTSSVTAVFDTGSSEFVVGMTGCVSCTSTTYNPTASPTAVLLIDPRLAAAANILNLTPETVSKYATILCRSQAAYVSQTDSIQMYQDVVTFPRRKLTVDDLCGPGGGAMTAAPNTQPVTDDLVVSAFPVGAVYEVTGSSNLNVLGMSAVLSVTKVDVDGVSMYLMPSCQTILKPAHESPVVSALAMHYGPTEALVWSQYIMPGDAGGWLVFGPMAIPCLRPQYVDLVPRLPDAEDGIPSTPMRYYVVAVRSMVVLHMDGTSTVLSDAPTYLVLDTGTTQFMLPGEAGVQTILDMDPTSDVLAVTLGDKASTVTLRYSGAALGLGSAPDYAPSATQAAPIVTVLPASSASIFSSKLDVGILGCTAMRGLYMEYNLTALRVGIGAPPLLL